jgi:DNA end-binding protein Ku
MSAHAIGSATISFGLVSVPIQMYSSGESAATISFNWLHKKCGTRVKQQYYCPKDDEVVERDDMVKGYEFQKGQYVLFTKDELKSLEEKGTGSIDVREFVEEKHVDRRYVDRTYFLGPDKGGEKAYRLLAEALKKTGRVAIGQYAARGKQYLILLRPLEDGLAMEQLKYANEVRSIEDVPIPKVELKKSEIDLALQLVEQGKVDEFKPEQYEDNVRKRQLEQIERKVEGKEITEEPEEAPKTQILDLMQALKASIEGGKKGGKKAAAEEKKTAKRAEPARKRKVS